MRVQSIAAAFAFILGAVASGVASSPGDAVAGVPASGCAGKCERDYEEEAAKCGKIDDNDERLRCQTAAHDRYRSCGQECAAAEGRKQCVEKCYEKNREDHARCDKMPEGPERAKCRQAAQDNLANCIRECNKKK